MNCDSPLRLKEPQQQQQTCSDNEMHKEKTRSSELSNPDRNMFSLKDLRKFARTIQFEDTLTLWKHFSPQWKSQNQIISHEMNTEVGTKDSFLVSCELGMTKTGYSEFQ